MVSTILIVSLILGSSTITFSKRRTKAVSPETYVFHSDGVVAPIIRKSPLAIKGFNKSVRCFALPSI